MNSVKNAGTASLEFMQLITQITKKEVHVLYLLELLLFTSLKTTMWP